MADPLPASLAARLLREPTFHFALLAAALFGASALLRSGDDRVVEIDGSEVRARIAELEAANGASLSEEQRARVLDDYIDERILVREALARGLQEDPRIDDFLVQKMLHVLSADVIQPSASQLTAYFEANRARYAPETRLTVDEVVIAAAAGPPGALLARLRAGASPSELARDYAVHHGVLRQVTASALRNVFGATTAALILESELGAWVGPHTTVRGEHWFRVSERSEAPALRLEDLRDQVRLDWITEREAELLETRIAELRAGYRVLVAEGAPAP